MRKICEKGLRELGGRWTHDQHTTFFSEADSSFLEQNFSIAASIFGLLFLSFPSSDSSILSSTEMQTANQTNITPRTIVIARPALQNGALPQS